MYIYRPRVSGSPLKTLSRLVFICVLFAGSAIAQESDSESVSSLIDQLKNGDSNERTSAAGVLMNMGKEAKGAVPQLLEALKDPEESVRGVAAYALGDIGEEPDRVIPALIEALNDRDAQVRESVAYALWQFRKAAAPQLVSALKSPDARDRMNAAYALGEFGRDAREFLPQLLEALHDTNSVVRVSAAVALGKIKGGSVPELIEALKDPDDKVRASAATSLGNIEEAAKKAVPALTALLKDPHSNVRAKAAESLAQLSTILARERATEFSGELKTAADALRKSKDLEVRQYTDRVQQASDLLGLLWWEQWKQWILAHPTTCLIIIAYPALLLAWLVLLWMRPLWLLHINEALARTTDVKLPEKLGGFNVAPRYLVLVGFFHYHSRVLDAWVTKHISSAQKMFSSLPTVEERTIYVPLPVIIGSEPEADLSPVKLMPALSRSLICLQIWGEGGSGKTSLACRLAQWAMSPRRETRLSADHLMLPVLVEQDLVIQDTDPELPLFKAIKQQVRVMIDEDEAPPSGLLRQLLKKRRVLIIVDGFSEMNEASRKATLTGITDLPINAVIITTRSDEQLSAIPKTVIKPLRVKGNRLSTFMEAYLTARKKRDLFEDDEFFEACRRLSLIVGDRDVTALLAKLYAEQMIIAKEGAADADAPENIPELMLSYLNDLSRGAGPGDPDVRVTHRAAKSIAWECLKKTLRPTPARREDVLLALSRENDGETLLTYLESKLKLVQTVGVGRDRIRFILDPLAEYLAGMHLVDENGGDVQTWRNFLAQVDEQDGAHEDIKGFLLAIRDCCFARGKDAQGLIIVAGELARRAGIGPEESDRYKIEHRVRQLMKRLKYLEVQDRAHAVEELGFIGSPAKIAVKDVCTLLRDQYETVRRSAAVTLGYIGTGAKEAVPQLTETLLRDPDEYVREEATTALERIGEGAKEAIPWLVEALKDPDDGVRRSAANALGGIGAKAKETVVPQLMEALNDPDQGVRRSAAAALGRIGEGAEEAVPQLIEALRDPVANVRSGAATALGSIKEGAKRAMPQLIMALGDPEESVRVSSVYALGMIKAGAKPAIPALIEALSDSSEDVRFRAAEALGNIGEEAKEAVPQLTEALRDSDQDFRRIAADSLGNIGAGATEAVPPLIEALRDPNEYIRGWVTEALGMIGAKAKEVVMPQLQEALKDPDEGVRRCAASALEKIGVETKELGLS